MNGDVLGGGSLDVSIGMKENLEKGKRGRSIGENRIVGSEVNMLVVV